MSFESTPEHQGKGIGRQLLEEVLSRGKEVRLQVRKDNPALELYKNAGFEIIDENEKKYKMAAHRNRGFKKRS